MLVAGRPLIRDCLARCIRRAYEMDVAEAATVDDALTTVRARHVDVTMLILDGHPGADQSVKLLQRLAEGEGKPPVIVMADNDELGQIVRVMKAGARGYISTSMGLDVAIEAIRLVRAGGQFLPAQSVLEGEASNAASPAGERPDALQRMFTTRQAAVVEALRKGMANKIIAYELNMQESTVKVHVRNIMKKLKARNRTEVAYLANQLLG